MTIEQSGALPFQKGQCSRRLIYSNQRKNVSFRNFNETSVNVIMKIKIEPLIKRVQKSKKLLACIMNVSMFAMFKPTGEARWAKRGTFFEIANNVLG